MGGAVEAPAEVAIYLDAEAMKLATEISHLRLTVRLYADRMAGIIVSSATYIWLAVMNNDQRSSSRLLRSGLLIAGLGSLGALIVMVVTGIEKVNTGHGLDTYRTFWLVEFNWVAFLILLAVLVVALLGGLWFRYLEWRELQQLRAKYGAKEA